MQPKPFFTGRTIGFLTLLVIAGVIVAFYAFNNYIYEQKQPYVAADYKDAEYVIQGMKVRLTDGQAVTENTDDSVSKAITTYFGNELKTDLDGDGREDVVFLITQSPGGSGTFYYAVAALNTERGYVGSEAAFIGDRIAPQTTEKGSGKTIVVNYADRAPGEPFSTPPSVGKSLVLLFNPEFMQFGEVVKDFEGEADPSLMKLNMKTWVWISALYNDGRDVLPKKVGAFGITFGDDGKFAATTDCNSIGGSYEASTSTIAFSQIFSTKMFCEDSQENEFALFLANAEGYHFTSKGELIIDLKFDSGSVVFR